MKFYVATRLQENARPVRDALVAAGHVCTATWIDEAGYGLGSATMGSKTPVEKAAIAARDDFEIRASDALVLVSEPDGAYVPGGKHVETGIAIGLDKPVYVVGKAENVFHWHPLVTRYADVPALLEALS